MMVEPAATKTGLALRGPEEVYLHYIGRFGYDADGDPDAIALFTYALVERDKYDYFRQFRENHDNQDPSAEAVAEWFLAKPSEYFEEKYRFSLQWYKAFARLLLEDDIEKQKKTAIRDAIGSKLDFMSQLWISLTTNFIFVILIGAVAAYVLTDFSPIAWVKRHFHGAQ